MPYNSSYYCEFYQYSIKCFPENNVGTFIFWEILKIVYYIYAGQC